MRRVVTDPGFARCQDPATHANHEGRRASVPGAQLRYSVGGRTASASIDLSSGEISNDVPATIAGPTVLRIG